MAEENKPEKVKRKPKVATKLYPLKVDWNIGSEEYKAGDKAPFTDKAAEFYKNKNII